MLYMVPRIGIDKVISAVREHYRASEEEFRGNSHRSSRLRAMAAWIALDTEGCTITELARLTARDLSTLSTAVRRLQGRAEKDSLLAEDRDEIVKIARSQA